MPYRNEHACRLNPPSKYDKMRRGTRKHKGKAYGVIFGHPKKGGAWEEQAYRYDRKTWKADEARAHCKSHDGTFEPAAPKKKESQAVPRREGHSWMLSTPAFGIALRKVDTKQHVLRGVALVTEGEAQGHHIHLDSEFIDDVIEQGNATRTGLKVRFGHPTMSSTALGTFLGRAKLLWRDDIGGQALVRADIFLAASAADTPQGDLRGYVERLAAEDDQAFGMSIVFEPGRRYRKTATGEKVYGPVDDRWQDAPAKDFVELEKLLASDAVDDPASNPNGLFSAWHRETFAGQVTEFLDLHPEVFAVVDEHPEVIDEFMDRYKAYRRREAMSEKEASQADELEAEVVETETEEEETTLTADAASEEAPKPDVSEADAEETKDEEAAPEAPAEEPAPEPEPSDGQRYLDAFGEVGAVAFAQGKSFDEAAVMAKAATDDRIAGLEADNQALRRQLVALRGIDEPASADPEPDSSETELEKVVAVYLEGGNSREEAEAKAQKVIAARERKRNA